MTLPHTSIKMWLASFFFKFHFCFYFLQSYLAFWSHGISIWSFTFPLVLIAIPKYFILPLSFTFSALTFSSTFSASYCFCLYHHKTSLFHLSHLNFTIFYFYFFWYFIYLCCLMRNTLLVQRLILFLLFFSTFLLLFLQMVSIFLYLISYKFMWYIDIVAVSQFFHFCEIVLVIICIYSVCMNETLYVFFIW